MESKKRFLAELSKSKINVKDEAVEKMICYMQEILLKNKEVNLTAIKDEDEFIEKQLIDSLLLVKREELIKSETIIDIGTGAGFPGIPLAINFPEKKFTLVDSMNKKLKIIDELCKKLSINNVTTVHGRAESLGQSRAYREKYDLCLVKAVANMNVLMEYCLPLVKIGGSFVAYKGSKAESEAMEAHKAAVILGGAVPELSGEGYGNYINIDNHKLVITKKIKKTPKKYPRKEGTPRKEPIK